jgi:hypothetical protein
MNSMTTSGDAFTVIDLATLDTFTSVTGVDPPDTTRERYGPAGRERHTGDWYSRRGDGCCDRDVPAVSWLRRLARRAAAIYVVVSTQRTA